MSPFGEQIWAHTVSASGRGWVGWHRFLDCSHTPCMHVLAQQCKVNRGGGWLSSTFVRLYGHLGAYQQILLLSYIRLAIEVIAARVFRAPWSNQKIKYLKVWGFQDLWQANDSTLVHGYLGPCASRLLMLSGCDQQTLPSLSLRPFHPSFQNVIILLHAAY